MVIVSPDSLSCCFWSCPSEAEAPSVQQFVTTARAGLRARHEGEHADAGARPRPDTSGNSSEAIASGQRTSIARGKLLAFIFWVLGLGRGLQIMVQNRYLSNNIYGKLYNSVIRTDG